MGVLTILDAVTGSASSSMRVSETEKKELSDRTRLTSEHVLTEIIRCFRGRDQLYLLTLSGSAVFMLFFMKSGVSSGKCA